MLARVPADAAAERVAGDADVGGRAVQGGEARSAAAGSTTSLPAGAGADPGAARAGVDLDALHLGGLQEQGAVELERPRAVAGALRRDPEAVLAGEATTRSRPAHRRRGRPTAGRWSTVRLKACRAASQSASCGVVTRPERLVARASNSFFSAAGTVIFPSVEFRVTGEPAAPRPVGSRHLRKAAPRPSARTVLLN